MGSIGLDASAPTGLWECASHTRAITVISTTVRLVAPTVPTGLGASDPMAAWSFAGHISSKKESRRSMVTGAAAKVFWWVELAVKPGELANFEKLTGQMVESTRNETGVLAYQRFVSDDR